MWKIQQVFHRAEPFMCNFSFDFPNSDTNMFMELGISPFYTVYICDPNEKLPF